MNDESLTELKIVVERAVRPVRATMSRKRRMREELLAHLLSIFEQESQRVGDEQAALLQTKRRFGDPLELTPELQGSVSWWARMRFAFEKHSFQPGDSAVRVAAVSLLQMVLVIFGMLLMAMLVSSRRGGFADFRQLAHFSLVVGVVLPAFTLLFLFFAEQIARSLYGERTERSLSKVVIYCLASLAVFPILGFVTYLAMSFDLAEAVAHFRFACCFAPVLPLLFVVMGRPLIEEICYKQQWANLEIGD